MMQLDVEAANEKMMKVGMLIHDICYFFFVMFILIDFVFLIVMFTLPWVWYLYLIGFFISCYCTYRFYDLSMRCDYIFELNTGTSGDE
jgi:sensor histidine kinase YesM